MSTRRHHATNMQTVKIKPMRYSILLPILFVGMMMSCSKDNNNDHNKTSYIEYSLNGATCNGLFEIRDDGDPNTLEATGVIVPASQDLPEVIIFTFSDTSGQRYVSFTIPAKETGNNPILLTYDSDFGMGIVHQQEQWLLSSGVENTVLGVSIDIKKIERENLSFGFTLLKKLELHFEGIMTYRNDMNEVEMHTVNGDLYYYNAF
jgi:hypothetical protein